MWLTEDKKDSKVKDIKSDIFDAPFSEKKARSDDPLFAERDVKKSSEKKDEKKTGKTNEDK